MRFEALAWSLFEVFAPVLGGEARRRLAWITREWILLGGWAYDLLVPYLALLLGSISGRDAGLTTIPAAAWFRCSLACLAGLAAAWLIRGRLPNPPQSYTTTLDALRPEPRLALYRAAMTLWVPDLSLAIAAGGLLAIIEWGLTIRPWRREVFNPPAGSKLLRIIFSGLIFWATHNLWLTAAMQAGIVLLARSMRSESSSKDVSASKTRVQSSPSTSPESDEETQAS